MVLGRYRCSICNEIKVNTNRILVPWFEKKGERFGVCVKCYRTMKRLGYTTINGYKNWAEGTMHMYGLTDNENPGVPDWFDQNLKPCDCEPRHGKTIKEHVGYSDFYYSMIRCDKCGQRWCFYLEG